VGGQRWGGAKFWLAVLTDLKNRGITDVFFLVCDGLKGLPDVVSNVWPLTTVQGCIIHLIRNTFRLASRRDWDRLKRDVKLIYTAPNEAAARAALDDLTDSWGARYPAMIRLWENAWAEFIPFLDYDAEIRGVICSTNAIESLNARYRRAVKARGHFPTEQAGWIQPVRATPGGFSWADSSWSRASAGVRQPSRLRGLLLSCAATYSR
jgi:putative transposase